MGSEHYCLRWNNHQSNLLGVFSQLLRDESLVDVTLACSEGHSIRAHKVVLSACSSYFQTLFVDHPSRHPIVILKDVRFTELRTLIEFMYKGEVNVEYCQLSALLKTAESLKVKGLAEMTRDYKQEPEQVEPTELVGPGRLQQQQRQQQQSSSSSSSGGALTTAISGGNASGGVGGGGNGSTTSLTQPPPPSRSPSIEDNDMLQSTSQSPVQNLRIRSPIDSQLQLQHSQCDNDVQQLQQTASAASSVLASSKQRPPSPDNLNRNLSNSPTNSDCGPSDMSIHSNSNNMVPSCSGMNVPIICSRLPSPHGNEPLPGPSNLPPVQQVPLSLKKEVDWSGGLEDKNSGESSSDFIRHPHDSGSAEVERPASSPLERPSSTQSSRSSTPFALPFPSLPTSILEVGLIHPSLLSEEMFRCPSCMAAFPSIWLLEQHTALQHIGTLNSMEKPFICEQCGQSYRYRSAYVKHREQNHRARLPADKLFSCDVCGMQFRYLKSFKKHRLNHALEKLHGKSAAHHNALNAHQNEGDVAVSPKNNLMDNSSDQVSSSNEMMMEVKEDGIQVKKESIEDCNGEGGASSDVEKTEAEQDDTIDSMATLSFPVTSGINNLDILRSSHESSIISFLRADAVEKQRERRFACPFCGKCVRSKENLKLHVRKHTGERPFVCLFCGRAFGGKSDLTRHLRIHTGERPYHCDMCGKCFARADYLSKHLTTHINTSR